MAFAVDINASVASRKDDTASPMALVGFGAISVQATPNNSCIGAIGLSPGDGASATIVWISRLNPQDSILDIDHALCF